MSSILIGMPVMQAAGGGSIATTMLTFGGVILIFYFFIIRPQNKKNKEAQKMLSGLKKFDKVVTIGGIRGVVQTVKEQTVIVKVDDNAKIEFTKTAIAAVLESHDVKAEKDEKETKEIKEK
ncbi:MAG: preprotein translocase subunit YajC [Spirochaetia bacterium]|nr:preprotein translocase subunit YajC [Spirochaetia bacterium]